MKKVNKQLSKSKQTAAKKTQLKVNLKSKQTADNQPKSKQTIDL